MPGDRPQPVEALDVEVLESRIAAVGAGLARRLADWLELVAEYDQRGAARRWGFRSTASWLAWRCDIGERAAREHVRVARALRDRPEVRSGFAAGALSYSKVRAITRAHASEDEQALLELANRCTADELERAVRGLRSAPSADVDVANEVHARRRLAWWWNRDGALQLHASLPPEDGAALVEALETAAEALHGAPHADGSGDENAEASWRPPLVARRADALAEMAHSGCPRTQVVLHVDAAALACTADDAADREGGLCALRDGPSIPSETARRLSCDAEVIASGVAARPADLGRARRVVSPALRTSLEQRDGGCRFPGCDRRHQLHAHHVVHWAHGGATDRDNLVLLCRFHHRLVHEDGFAVERRGQGAFAFRRPDGLPVEDRPPPVLEPAVAA